VVDVSRAREYLVENIDLTDMVIDSHLALSVIPCDDVDICFVLRCDPYLLYDRLSRKGFSEDKVLENVQAEILDIVLGEAVSLCGSEKVVQIDVSMGVGEKVDEVVEMIKRGESILSDSVDWLSKIVERGDLDRFFPPTG
jgi:adenylate kinase